MTNKQNLHVHTTYADGRDTPEEIILAAIEKGFDSIGFSEHSYMPYSTYPYQMTVADTETYKKEIAALKSKYKGIIDVFCGIEFELFSDIDTHDFDYLIGSVHYLEHNGNIIGFDRGLSETVALINNHFDGYVLKFAKKYFETVMVLPEKRSFDIVGHFDVLAKNNEKGHFIDTLSDSYLKMGIEAINSLRGKIPLFEVNTGAISRGYTSIPYPQTEFLKEFKRCGFGAIITSDCHNKDFLDCGYDKAQQLLLEAGFKSKWILTDSGFTEVSI